MRTASEIMAATDPAALGWRLVPIEPTPKMLKAAAKSMSPGRRPVEEWVPVSVKHRIRYQAMIAAAPSGGSRND